jgi:hypothetical protein
MEDRQVADKIQIRRDTAANWTSANPTLAQGELGLETDTSKIKAGTGSTAWTSLGYYTLGVSGVPAASITGTISQSQLAAEAVNEAKMQVSNAPTNGYMLTAQSGNTGGLTWAAAPTSSTDHGAVGTYIIGRPANYTNYAPGATASSLKVTSIFRNNQASYGTLYDNVAWDTNVTPTSVSGTWRAMSHCSYISSNTGGIGLWVRIS